MKHFKFLSLMLMAIVAMFAFTACGDDDDKDNKGGQQGGGGDTSELAGNWTAVAFTPEGGSRFEINRKNENHWQWCLRFVLTDNEITQYAINYQGSEGYRGREEKTLIGKYRVEGNAFIIYDYYEGYHNVKDQEESGSGIMATEPIQTTFSLSNSIFTLTIAGYGVYELQKTDGGEQGGEGQGGGQGEEQGEASLLGTWKTIRIAGNATDYSTGEVLESWDKYPTLDEAKDLEKESLKYMEYTFNKDGSLKVQSFDESSREFNIIMEGTWIQNEDIVTVTLILDEKNSFSKTFNIVELTADKLTLHETYIDDEFEVHGRDGRYKVVYDESVYCTRK